MLPIANPRCSCGVLEETRIIEAVTVPLNTPTKKRIITRYGTDGANAIAIRQTEQAKFARSIMSLRPYTSESTPHTGANTLNAR
ncbi:hypothetical protein SDC9_211320 [bioreactor metagenome]|uniref:Uncharacterized protein n=1 Tax=bioreactor metagenome TaxID=1076179 RepID=A0A645JJE4_9ZZZZ